MSADSIQTKINLYDEDKYYLSLSNLFINSPLFKAKLFEFFNYDIRRFYNATKDDLMEFSEIYDNITIPRNFFRELDKVDLNKTYDYLDEANIKFITYKDKNYPQNLKNIESFPLSLYYNGSLEGINFDRTIALVGSRNATESAKANVRNILAGFINSDVVIVSGLAAGIDTSAHLSAIENNLKTIAVIGSGLNHIYPKTNKKLYETIENGFGVIFSEYPCSMPPMPVNFPQRNRIITGLSKGVIIAEARKKSGAMISARYALEQGRELMCIPGLITNPNCEGIYHLIKNGASVITNANDILSVLNWELIPKKPHEISLSGIDKDIYDLIASDEFSIEGLKQKLDVGINDLMVKLTQMELKGLIVQKNGLYYLK